MSDTTADEPEERPPVKPWVKVAIAGTAVALAGTFAMFFSGNIPVPFLHHKEEPPPVRVDMSYGIGPLQRPDPAVIPDPPKPTPAAAILKQQAAQPAQDDSRRKALESGLGGYVIKAGAAPANAASGKVAGADPNGLPAADQPDALEASLIPTKLDGTRVSELPNPRWLIEQGRVLPCTQQTRINSTLPGAVTAVLSENIRGETGDVTLLGKGSRVFGTLQHALINGLDRVAVLWQSITTPVMYGTDGMPHQYRIQTDSPAASEVGEIGLDGDVDRHLWKKLGGILGISLIQGAIQAGVGLAQNRGGNNNTTLNLNSFSYGGNSAADELLRSWISIPDVLTRDQGLPCSIFVVRDLSFAGAYKLVQR